MRRSFRKAVTIGGKKCGNGKKNCRELAGIFLVKSTIFIQFPVHFNASCGELGDMF